MMQQMVSQHRVSQLLVQGHLLGSVALLLWLFPLYGPLLPLVCLVTMIVLALGVSVQQHPWDRRVAISGTAFVFGAGSVYSLSCLGEPQERGLHLFLLSNVVYHYGEFLFVNYCHHPTLSWNSFLLNHSLPYSLALAITLAEYCLARHLGYSKDCLPLSLLGLSFCVAGQSLRIGAFVVARSNFNHLIQHRKSPDHVLVTHGVYALSRHPSYLGFFLTQVGNQLLLANVCSQALSLLVTYRFFLNRIDYEEFTLREFFPEYAHYASHTGIGIPFLQGFLDKRRRREIEWAKLEEQEEQAQVIRSKQQ